MAGSVRRSEKNFIPSFVQSKIKGVGDQSVDWTVGHIETFISSVLKNSSSPVIIINKDFTVRYVNPAFERLTGFSFNKVIGISPPYPWWIEGTEDSEKRLRSQLQIQNPQTVESLFKNKNGKKFWVRIYSTPALYEGQIQYFLGQGIAIGDIKNDEMSHLNYQKERRSLALDIKLSKERKRYGSLDKQNILTRRQQEVLQLIAQGKSTKEIAGLISISVKTVETYRQQIMDRLDIFSIAGLTQYAIREGIVALTI